MKYGPEICRLVGLVFLIGSWWVSSCSAYAFDAMQAGDLVQSTSPAIRDNGTGLSEKIDAQSVLPSVDRPVPQIVQIANSVRVASALDNRQPVGVGELSNMRGGFLMADGVEFDFGADMQTLVNGQLALQTTVQWSPSGAIVQQTSSTGANVVSIPASSLASEFGMPSVGLVTTGVEISTSSGSIEIAANVTGGQVQNLLINTSNNQTITQNTAVTLAIYNFSSWQQQIALQTVSAQLAKQILATSSFGH
jgi:hypothetical protein